MQIKTILRSLLLAYALSGICLLLLALMVFKLDIGQGTVTVGILVIYGRLFVWKTHASK